MSLKDVPFGEMEAFNVVIEISRGSQDKYEYDEHTDVIKLDRVLFGSQRYPANYGFIPETRAEDGDHSDALVFSTNPFIVGSVVPVRAIGIMHMIDKGEVDNKILTVPVDDPRFAHVQSIQDIDEHTLKEIKNFFETYKELEGKKVEIKGFADKAEAIAELESTKAAFSKE